MARSPSIEEIMLVYRMLNAPSPKEIDLGFLARIYRAQKNLSIDKAADKIGISRQLLSQIEAGKIPQKGKLISLANFYGTNFEKALHELKYL
ncbi:MAG: helix-turn-helix domain-containing protein [Oligoflexia bacterium]|nr:helix-turn-helix domain-containing protein [Oligoflexia bacterium]